MIEYIPSGDSAFLVKFGNEISEEINRKVRAYFIALSNKKLEGIIECVPSYTDLMVLYDPLKIQYKSLLKELKILAENISEIEIPEAKTVEIPVCYGGNFGEDMDAVIAHTGLREQEIIEKHSQNSYLVYMLGFTPGFCYLGGMDKSIATPRKEVPSQKILAGSVGLAAEQTGIYPIESPGGWQIIGRTPYRLFDPNRKPEFLLQAGDYLKFYPISEEEYYKLNEND
ncbi:5-oxoprolinase subunit PxpB [Marinifilum caeruleilacunae]|jgi:KipI family sensor histidine kinase inhibitor|uniref:5-oxoprolinase subunit PxpB n=1 Tax=Marinifilum caeruleilacunae TaxID=2499076 RepID=A0ABX1WRX5_9BACT|nr:5-oxoprolinase subunit PxpB [Marinifilum caeruleilacunae]NOU58817.1 5-oxoprolinase subunit PxpB [Marinifilum caeruleilacunae]